MKASRFQTLVLLLIPLYLPECEVYGQKPDSGSQKVTVTTVQAGPATITQPYLGRISSQRHIEVRATEDGYLQEIFVKEGQAVKKGDLMFKFASVLHQARLDAELAEVQIAQLELNNTKRLLDKKAVSEDEIQLLNAKLAKAKAKADLERAKLDFTNVRAPFDGIIDRFPLQLGSFVLKGETLTNLFDNTMVRVYFNVPEKHYLEYMAKGNQSKESLEIELTMADHRKFSHTGKISAIDAKFNAENGNIAFRADFPNPDRVLRHGQSGTVLINRVLKDAILIPQRATFEDQDRRYVYVVDKDHVAHRREVAIQNETNDLFVVQTGVGVGDMIVLDGIRMIHDGDKVEYENQDLKK